MANTRRSDTIIGLLMRNDAMSVSHLAGQLGVS